ncbi:hypothetical protein BDN70DRAFT_877886 [Pholiota conissans]|uniref:Uncharacterized protein n=1 Tax=Pholiota conissans TaxID=109636 RepID=A0A9P5Z347_9AGAR|nr:hypothetical protein BDN70DRAFT_877886 [Pholiota conissans]
MCGWGSSADEYCFSHSSIAGAPSFFAVTKFITYRYSDKIHFLSLRPSSSSGLSSSSAILRSIFALMPADVIRRPYCRASRVISRPRAPLNYAYLFRRLFPFLFYIFDSYHTIFSFLFSLL